MSITAIAPTVANHTEVELDDSGKQRLTHIVNRPDGKASTVAWLTEARVFGLEVEALCGYRWVPMRDPKRFPVCDKCITAAGILVHGDAS